MEKQTHYPLIRTIYLYLFTLVGLTLLVIGSVRFLNMGLRAFIFTQAEEEERTMFRQPPLPTIGLEKITETNADQSLKLKEKISLSSEEKEALQNWLINYNDWQERYARLDPVRARRHREASLNLAMILIGLPLYLYHWSIIKKETTG